MAYAKNICVPFIRKQWRARPAAGTSYAPARGTRIMRLGASTSLVFPALVFGLFAGGVLPVSAAEQPAKETALPIVRTANSGQWSAAATWEGGKVPAGNVRVLIRQGHRVVYDTKSTKPIRSLTISGTLSFA